MFDFKTSGLGWSTGNTTAPVFDGECMNMTSTGSNGLITADLSSQKIFGGNYRYLIVRVKMTNTIDTADKQMKVYVSTFDENGAAVDALWTTSAPSKPMRFSQNGQFVTYVTDLGSVGHYSQNYIGTFAVGMGMYTAGIGLSVDYVALADASAVDRTVSFDANTEDAVSGMPESMSVVMGDSLSLGAVAAPAREGWRFLGWSATPGGAVVSELSDVRENTTLYAVWSNSPQITVTYDSNAMGDTVAGMPTPRSARFDVGTEVDLSSSVPERAGFDFVGWSTTRDSKDLVSDGFIAANTLTLYAIWQEAGGSWYFEKENPGWSPNKATADLTGGSLYVVPASSSDPQLASPTIKKSTVLYKKVHVVMELSFPSGVNSTLVQLFSSIDGKSYSEASSVSLTASSSDGKKEYVFDFSSNPVWNSGEYCTRLRFDPCSSSTVTAKIYSIRFESCGDALVFGAHGGTGSQSPVLAENSSAVLPKCTFTRSGYAFDGWTKDGENVLPAGSAVSVSGIATYYAVWRSLGGLDSMTKLVYPGFRTKAMIFSYDDGNTQGDTELIEKFNATGLVGSFNLIGRNYVNLTEEQKESYRRLYAGHEVANHTQNHYNMTTRDSATSEYIYSDTQCIDDIALGQKTLSELFGTRIEGLAWPNTNPNRKAISDYVTSNYLYHRGAPVETGSFAVPASFEPTWNFTCIHSWSGKTYFLNYLDKYLGLESEELSLFSVWGHSAQFISDGNWNELDEFISVYKNSGEDFWNPTCIDYVKYINAGKALITTPDYIYNPSDAVLCVKVGDTELTLPAFSLYDGEKITENVYTPTASGADASFVCDMTEHPESAIVVIAAYSADGRLLGAKIENLAGGKPEAINTSLVFDGTADKVTAYIFEDTETLKPCRLSLHAARDYAEG